MMMFARTHGGNDPNGGDKKVDGKQLEVAERMKIGDEVYIHGFIDEIRKDCVIIKNNGGFFGTVPEEIVTKDIIVSDNWVPLGEGKPEDHELIMVTRWTDMISDDIVSLATYEDGKYISLLGEDLTSKTTAWMPYPDTYKPKG